MEEPRNEPVLQYKNGSEERHLLDLALAKYWDNVTDISAVLDPGFTDSTSSAKELHMQYVPFDNQHVVARYAHATKEQIEKGIAFALSVRRQWENTPLEERVKYFLKAADLAATKYRADLNAATMLGQGKTVVQAEIDAACEMIDFWRFNCYYALQLAQCQPMSTNTSSNRMILRGLEGFVAAISPFNFTSIGGNLATAPAIMGNVVIWKPARTALLSNYLSFKILKEAGLPDGVISFVPTDGATFGDSVVNNQHLAGINFTGSLPVFKQLWTQVSNNLDRYVNFPRLCGECGGKNFHFVHVSADIPTVVSCTVRSAFEYQGQKCSACSRMYVPSSLWPRIKTDIINVLKEVKCSDPRDYESFMTAVIDKNAFNSIKSYIDDARSNPNLSIVFGGKCDSSKGYFIEPTVVQCSNPNEKIFKEASFVSLPPLSGEIFGPVLSVYPYDDEALYDVLSSVKEHTPFGLTGSIFATDNAFIDTALYELREAAGNLYVNDKSTGAVVGQQPFGGARMSGTNDKAGGLHYLLKWASPLVVKSTSVPLHEWRYPCME